MRVSYIGPRAWQTRQRAAAHRGVTVCASSCCLKLHGGLLSKRSAVYTDDWMWPSTRHTHTYCDTIVYICSLCPSSPPGESMWEIEVFQLIHKSTHNSQSGHFWECFEEILWSRLLKCEWCQGFFAPRQNWISVWTKQGISGLNGLFFLLSSDVHSYPVKIQNYLQNV